MGRFVLAVGLSVVVGACGPTYAMHPPTEPILNTHADPEPTPSKVAASSDAPSESRVDQVGLASWYGSELAGKRTASGERFDPRLFTAAHRRLPFGTWVEVRRVDTGRTVRVRINDRGPAVTAGVSASARSSGQTGKRIIDLSRRAAEELDLVRAGVVLVELRVVDGP
jgi:rare lipoprotein A